MTQLTPDNLRVDLCIEGSWGNALIGAWSNRAVHVLTEAGLSWSRGRTGESKTADPGTAQLTFKNDSTGLYSPRATTGANYPYLLRNTPLRIGLGKPVTGNVASGTGTTVTAPICENTAAGASVRWIGYIMGAQNFTTPAGYAGTTEVDTASWTYARAVNAAVAGTVPASASTASVGGAWVACQYAVPNGVIDSTAVDDTLDGYEAAGVLISTSTAGQVHVVTCIWTADPNNRMQPPNFRDHLVPADLYLVVDSGPSAGPRMAVWAWTQKAGQTGGVYHLAAQDGETGCTMILSRYNSADVYTPRFCGEIADWPMVFDKSTGVILAPVTAAGALRRINASQDVISPLRTAFLESQQVLHYWPLEDQTGSTKFTAAWGGSPMRFVGTPNPGSVTAIAGSSPTPSLTGGGGSATVTADTGASWGLGCVVSIPEAGTAAGTTLLCALMGGYGSTIATYSINYQSNTVLNYKITYRSGAAATTGSIGSMTTAMPNGVNGKQFLLFLTMTQSGADVPFTVSMINTTPSEAVGLYQTGGTAAAHTMSRLTAVSVGVDPDLASTLGTDDVSVGHVFVLADNQFKYGTYRTAAARGYDSYLASEVALVATKDAGFQCALTYNTAVDTWKAGVCTVGPLGGTLSALERASQAIMSDAAGFVGIDWRPLPSIESNDPVLTLSYTGQVLSGELAPVDDDALIVTDQTVTTPDGGTGVSSATTAPYGRYRAVEELPADGDDNAQYLADWLVHVGTWDAARWPTITVEMSATGAAAFNMVPISIGDTIRLSNLPAFTGPTPIDLVIVGVAEEIVSAALWRVTYTTMLQGPWSVLVPELAARWDTIGDDVTVSTTDVYVGM